MEKLGERIGLYDFWVSFYPGIIGVLELLLFTGASWSIYSRCSIVAALKGIAPSSMSTWVVVIIASFFMGTVLQEAGRWLRYLTKAPNAADGLLNPEAGVFTEKERNSFRSFLVNYGWDGECTDNSNEIFHRINAEAQECGIATRYVKLSVLQNMSLSLSAAMLFGAIASLVLFILGIVNGRGNIALLMAVIGIICILSTMLFYRRSNRFNRYWVRNLVYAMSTRSGGMGKSKNGN